MSLLHVPLHVVLHAAFCMPLLHAALCIVHFVCHFRIVVFACRSLHFVTLYVTFMSLCMPLLHVTLHVTFRMSLFTSFSASCPKRNSVNQWQLCKVCTFFIIYLIDRRIWLHSFLRCGTFFLRFFHGRIVSHGCRYRDGAAKRACLIRCKPFQLASSGHRQTSVSIPMNALFSGQPNKFRFILSLVERSFS